MLPHEIGERERETARGTLKDIEIGIFSSSSSSSVSVFLFHFSSVHTYSFGVFFFAFRALHRLPTVSCVGLFSSWEPKVDRCSDANTKHEAKQKTESPREACVCMRTGTGNTKQEIRAFPKCAIGHIMHQYASWSAFCAPSKE